MNDYLTNPITSRVLAARLAVVKTAFPVLGNCNHRRYLWLHKYIGGVPEQFYSRSVFQLLHSWLADQYKVRHADLREYLAANLASISGALARLDEVNSAKWHDDTFPSNDDERIRLIDQEVHPAYLSLVEGVFVPLLHIAAQFSRIDRGKGIEGLDAYNIAEELYSSNLAPIIAPYNHTVRNAIAHGGATYLGFDIEYRDKKAITSLSWREMIALCDDMLDTCNGLAFAWSLFMLSHESQGFMLPRHCVLEELKAQTQTPYWEIVKTIPVKIGERDQLNIYASALTRDRLKVHYSAFQTGLLAGYLAPSFSRYFVSIRSPYALPGWAAFKREDVQRFLSKTETTSQDLLGVVEENLLFFAPRLSLPRFLWRVHTLWTLLRAHWPVHVAENRKSRGLPMIEIRNVSIHRDGWKCVVRGQAFLELADRKITQGLIRRYRSAMIRKTVSTAKKSTGWTSGLRFLPLGFAYLSVFQTNYRKRRLENYGLGPDLVCTLRFSRIPRIRFPDILDSEVEVQGKWRIAWNRAWLNLSDGVDGADAQALKPE